MLKVYNCVNCTKHETCAVLHRSHVLYISDIKMCQNNMFDHYYCIVILLLKIFGGNNLKNLTFATYNGVRHERCVGFKNSSFRAKTNMSS